MEGYYNPGPDPQGGGGGGGDFIGAAINSGAMLYDSHKNRQNSKWNTNKTIAAQKAEAELAYQRSVDMWNRQNMYNTPQAQMDRFKAAGLNPHLIYGQGSSGLASSPPQYQPPNIQYRYEAPQYGAAIQSFLPTLMAVGTWMQNMRSSEAGIRKTVTDTDRAGQLIKYLEEANPKILEGLENKLTLFPYQKQTADYGSNIARTKLFELEQDFRYQYGDSLFKQMDSAWQTKSGEQGGMAPLGGMKRLQFLEQESKTRLSQAKASWSDFDITDPQQIMMMVLQGVMGLAGQTMRLSGRKSNLTSTGGRVRQTGELPISKRRLHPARRQ